MENPCAGLNGKIIYRWNIFQPGMVDDRRVCLFIVFRFALKKMTPIYAMVKRWDEWFMVIHPILGIQTYENGFMTFPHNRYILNYTQRFEHGQIYNYGNSNGTSDIIEILVGYTEDVHEIISHK